MIVVPSEAKIFLLCRKTEYVEAEMVRRSEFEQLAQLRDLLLHAMQRLNCRGIAAPQIGVFRQYMIFAKQDGRIVEMVNPEIIRMLGKETNGTECCLSVPPPGNACPVPRMQTVLMEYETVEAPGMRQEMMLSGIDAVVAQHEYDHLSGTYFTERVKTTDKRRILQEYEKWKQERGNHHAENHTRPLTAHRF